MPNSEDYSSRARARARTRDHKSMTVCYRWPPPALSRGGHRPRYQLQIERLFADAQVVVEDCEDREQDWAQQNLTDERDSAEGQAAQGVIEKWGGSDGEHE